MDSKLKSTRSAHRSAVTRLLTKFDVLKSDTNIQIREFKALDESVTQKQKLLIELNGKILDQTSEEEMEQEVIDSDEYMLNLDCKLREIREVILEKSKSNTPHDQTHPPPSAALNPNAMIYTPDVRSDNMNTCANDSLQDQYTFLPRPALQMHTRPSETTYDHRPSVSRSYTMNNHKLPRLDLPYFDGDVLKWQTFWDSFESSIHLNETLTPIQKFTYLNAQLQGSAAETIEGFALTNGNYETAVNLLRKRYGQTSTLIHAYMKALMNLPAPSNDLYSLRK